MTLESHEEALLCHLEINLQNYSPQGLGLKTMKEEKIEIIPNFPLFLTQLKSYIE